MFDTLRKRMQCLAFLSLLVVQVFSSAKTEAQTFTATRVDGRPATPEFDPVVDESTFGAVNTNSDSNAASEGGNINSPSIIRVPDWIPDSERVNPNANYYMYFANHRGQDIRMAWAQSLTGDWTLFNASGGSGSLNTNRAWGVNGNNTGTQTPNHGVLTMTGGQITAISADSSTNGFIASNHIASPEVIVDHVNQRIAMNFHATTQFLAQPGQGTGQRSFVTTSKYGLDFNPSAPTGNGGDTTLTTSATVIATWDNWNDTTAALDADNAVAGVSASLSGDAVRDVQSTEGSADGTFGSLDSPAAATGDGRMRLEKTGIFGVDPAPHLATSRTLIVTINNNSGAAIELDGVLFDLDGNSGAYNSWSVQQGATVLGTGGPAFGGPTVTGYVNADVTFAPITVANGASVAFDIVFSGATNGNPSALLDNFAVTSDTTTTTSPTNPQELQGMREVVTTRAYQRTFQVGGRFFAFTNEGELWRAPATNDAGEINTVANADSEGGIWNPSGINTTAAWWELLSDANNPLSQLYVNNGQNPNDVRHSGTYTRTHLDPNDTNVYTFFSSRDDTPEMIFLTVIDTNNGSTDSSDWEAIGQKIILRAELDWEGGDLPPTTSLNGAEINVNQLRDPYIFEDDHGTADVSDDKLYMFYTGEGEEAIGFAELSFNSNISNTSGPQGDLLPNTFLLADINLDGAVNFLDISPFISVLSTGGFQDEADINRDGSVNFLDISPFINELIASAD